MDHFQQDNSLKGFLAQNARSAAYHEAGHMVAAVLQGLPLRDGGIHIDLEGSWVSYYCHRLPGNDVASEVGTVEREKTIIAIYAAWVAQKKYFPDSDDSDSWESDRATATALINELRPAKPKMTRHLLCERAKQLVEANWFTIESLAVALLAKPVTPLPQLEFAKGWSKGTKMHEKFMSRGEVEDFFKKSHIQCG
jgi:hypothetical protein